jgi:hypothetical protein
MALIGCRQTAALFLIAADYCQHRAAKKRA